MASLPEPLAPLLAHPLRRAVLAAARDTPCYLVGGAIRDLWLLGSEWADWDLVVDSPEEMAGRLASELGGRSIRLGGDRFELHRVVSDAGTLDLQAPLEPTFEAELRRRDFTVNAVAIELTTGRLDDPLGGLPDLDARVLRQCSPGCFTEDPLRILRLLRFASGLPGFEIEPETLGAARSSVARIEAVAADRVREELRKIFSRRAKADNDAGRLAGRIGLFPWLWCPDDRREVDEGPALAELDHWLTRAEETAGEQTDRGDLEALHHAALLLSAVADDAASTGLVDRRWISKRCGRRIDRLLQPLDEPRSEGERRRWLALFAQQWLSAAALAMWRNRFAHTWPRTLSDLATTARTSGEAIWSGRSPLSGRELARLSGLDEGPRLGRLLDTLRQAWIDGDITSRDQAEAWVAEWLKRTGEGDGAEGRAASAPRRPAD